MRSSDDGEELARSICRDAASRLNVCAPAVLVSPFLNSPCLIGHWAPCGAAARGTLLTPAASYHEVFLHELAHLRRADWLWSLFARFAIATFWIQPLLWLLSRRIAASAEEVCDDYVLQFGGNRENYVQQLVHIAERNLPQSALAGVAMVSFKSALGRRSQRILDTTRVLSTSAGRWFACLAMVATLVATAAVATIYVGQPQRVVAGEHSAAVDGDADSDTDSPSEQTESSTGPTSDRVEVSGTVLGPMENRFPEQRS